MTASFTLSSSVEAVVQRCSLKKGVLRNFVKFTGRKETLAQVFSYEFCNISKSTYYRTRLMAASGYMHCEIDWAILLFNEEHTG